ncbi:ATP-binding cassette domain-containing protein [Natribacillus halophilus]|uniref:ABC transporter n=1 Tax=Natribacillus halophilus TaxID=549003 RepID=A0A1G8NIX7_9BACI|nr:ATP-binding cassette domain-containing protein [Natribacillus halophilus]SDI80102.1 ABC transporter [Natribacillus halophilus]
MIANINIKKAGYDNKKAVINDIRFSVSAGELVGLIGPNGAGKSTTIQAMFGLLKDSDDFIDWNDEDARYAYVPEQPVFYKELTLLEDLSLAASSLSIDESETWQRTEYLLDIFSMRDVKHHLT